MRELVKGDARPWWVGRKIRCEKCGGVWVLEEGDPVQVSPPGPQDPRSVEFGNVRCPTPGCYRLLSVSQWDPLESDVREVAHV